MRDSDFTEEFEYDENNPLHNRSIMPDRSNDLGLNDPMPENYATTMQGGHFHKDNRGLLHQCFHQCRTRWYVWLPVVFVFQILMFPLEHQAAEKMWQQPVLSDIGEFFGWAEEPHEFHDEPLPEQQSHT